MTHKEQYRQEYMKELRKHFQKLLKEFAELIDIMQISEETFEEWYKQKFPDEK